MSEAANNAAENTGDASQDTSSTQAQTNVNQGNNPNSDQGNTPAPEVNVQVDPKPGQKLTQEEVNSIVGKRVKEASSSAIENFVVKELGFTDPSEVKSIVQQYKEQQEAQKTEAEKLQSQLAREQKARESAEQTTNEIKEQAKKATLDSQARLIALGEEVNAKPDRVDAVLRLAELSAQDLVGDDFSIARDKVAKALNDVLQDYPEFSVQAPANIGNHGSMPVAGPPETNDFATMPREEFLAMVERAKMGEHIPLR